MYRNAPALVIISQIEQEWK